MLITVSIGMLLFFVFSVSYQVAARYVDLIPRAIWTEELSRMSFVWMTFLGAAAAVRRSSHFVIDLLPISDGKLGVGIEAISHIVVLIISVLIFIGSVQFFELGQARLSSATGISLSWFYLAIPVSMAFIIAFTIEKISVAFQLSVPDETEQ
jgi:TRAP-type C4-dicarboxylate transport system permease small subunit